MKRLPKDADPPSSLRFLSVMLIKRHVRFSILAPFGIVFFAADSSSPAGSTILDEETAEALSRKDPIAAQVWRMTEPEAEPAAEDADPPSSLRFLSVMLIKRHVRFSILAPWVRRFPSCGLLLAGRLDHLG
jgi:hypothetical protein